MSIFDITPVGAFMNSIDAAANKERRNEHYVKKGARLAHKNRRGRFGFWTKS